MSLAHIGVFIIALGFALVSIYIAKLLLKTSGIITTMGATVHAVETKLDKTINEIEATIVEMDQTASDVEEKLSGTNSLFLAVQDVGDTTEMMSDEIHSLTENYAQDDSLSGSRPFIRVIQFTEFGLGLVRSWKKGKSA